MAAIDTAMAVLHLVFAGLWTGSVAFVAWGVLPLARRGDLAPGSFEFVTSRLTRLSRLSAVVMLVTGGHLAGSRYTLESLTGTTSGTLVLAMVALWFVLAALVEVGSRRLGEDLDRGKIREPARNAGPFYRAAGVVAFLLLVDAGLLLGGLR